jgi:hypothetical protein
LRASRQRELQGSEGLSLLRLDALGCAELNIYETCTAPDPVPLPQLLNSQFWAGSQGSFYQPLEFRMAADALPAGRRHGRDLEGIPAQIGTLIAYRSEVTKVTLSADAVEVEYVNQYSGQKSCCAPITA